MGIVPALLVGSLVLRHVVVDYLCIWTPYLDLLILDLQNLTSNFKGRKWGIRPHFGPSGNPGFGVFWTLEIRGFRTSRTPPDTLRHGERDVE